MLDIHQLNVFLVAAETLNFTQTAQQLHMTQPSVSQHIQGLERHFDAQLFLRNGRNLELTDSGMVLLPLAREAVVLSQRIDENMISLKGGLYGHLIVGCSTTPGKYILPHILAQFHNRYPQVRVTCQVSPQLDALQGLQDGHAHFALFSLPHEGFPNIEAISFMCDPITLIVPRTHPWAQRAEIDPQELLQANLIMREASSGTFNAVREALAIHNIAMSDLRILITLGNAEAIAMAVEEGIGVGFVSNLVVERLCRGQVAEVRIRGLNICRQIFIGRSTRRPATNAQEAFWDFLAGENNNPSDVK